MDKLITRIKQNNANKIYYNIKKQYLKQVFFPT